MKATNWALWARVVGLGVGATTAGLFLWVGHPVLAVGVGWAFSGLAGLGFWVFSPGGPFQPDEREWAEGDALRHLSQFSTAARCQEMHGEPTQAQLLAAIRVREQGRERAGLDVRWQVVRNGTQDVEVVADDCTELMARQLAKACGGVARRVEPAEAAR